MIKINILKSGRTLVIKKSTGGVVTTKRILLKRK